VDELDLTVTSTHVRMGTRALAPDQWLVRDHAADGELALRRRLFDEQAPLVFACTPAAEAAAVETADLVKDSMQARGHQRDPDLADHHPLVRAGLSVQEDLCLMVQRDDAWHLEGALLCFPSLWSLPEKLGRPAAEIHAPVAHYAEELSSRVDSFFNRMATGKLAIRRNLSPWPACLLWMPTADVDPSLWDPPPDEPDQPRLWLRSERQTLQRLPTTGAILFTIRVQMAAVAVLAASPARARDLAAWLRGPGGESRRRHLGALLDPDLRWLDRIGNALADGTVTAD
jgi:hypothetical protein